MQCRGAWIQIQNLNAAYPNNAGHLQVDISRNLYEFHLVHWYTMLEQVEWSTIYIHLQNPDRKMNMHSNFQLNIMPCLGELNYIFLFSKHYTWIHIIYENTHTHAHTSLLSDLVSLWGDIEDHLKFLPLSKGHPRGPLLIAPAIVQVVKNHHFFIKPGVYMHG